MTDANFGFPAIENRYNILIDCNDTDTFLRLEKINLSWAAISIYGEKYIKHPRLQSLMELNEITSLGFITGEEEARAFAAGDYVKMHQSTLRKVDLIAIILSKISNRTLKTLEVKWYKKWWVKVSALVTLLGSIASIVSCLYPHAS